MLQTIDEPLRGYIYYDTVTFYSNQLIWGGLDSFAANIITCENYYLKDSGVKCSEIFNKIKFFPKQYKLKVLGII